IAEFIAVLSCALFTGAAVYITFVEHPARMLCGVEIAATEFAPSYRRATVMQATCAAVGLVASIAAWLAGATFWWLVAGATLGSVMPFTLIVILPTNKRLLSPELDRRSAETGRLLPPWGRLHAVRSVLSGLALLLFVYLAILRKGYLRTSNFGLVRLCVRKFREKHMSPPFRSKQEVIINAPLETVGAFNMDIT